MITLNNNTCYICLYRLHKERIKSRIRPRRVPEGVINKIHIEEFCDWFRNYVSNSLLIIFSIQ